MIRLLRKQYGIVRARIRNRYARRRISYTEYLMRYFWNFKVTESGRVIVYAAALVQILAWYSLTLPVYQLVVGLSFLMAGSMILGWLQVPRISVKGNVPERMTVGAPAQARFTLTNRGTRVARELGAWFFWTPFGRQHSKVGLSISGKDVVGMKHHTGPKFLERILTTPETTVESLEPGEETSIHLDMQFNRRGIYELPKLRVYSQFPFNVYRTPARLDADSVTLRKNTVIVLPDFVPAEGIDLPASRNHQPGGISLTSDVGESPEYIGSREYRSGDNVRRIDFRGWARRGEPVVREYQEEYFCRIAVIMDTYVRDAQSAAALEGVVRLTAAIADALSGGEYIIDLFAAGPDLYVFRSGRNTAHFDNILEILACLEGSHDNPFDEVGPALQDEIANISTAVFVFMDWDKTREQLVRMALESGAAIKIYLVCDGATTLPIEGADVLADSVMVFTSDEVARGAYEIL
ncbi:DUF58 domain-containing protein [bacterium AH-315-P07]|nr:DUF58 domain-containing protein [bacterium AH-315-P07]